MQSHHGRGHQAAWNHASLPSVIGFLSHLVCVCHAGLTLSIVLSDSLTRQEGEMCLIDAALDSYLWLLI